MFKKDHAVFLALVLGFFGPGYDCNRQASDGCLYYIPHVVLTMQKIMFHFQVSAKI